MSDLRGLTWDQIEEMSRGYSVNKIYVRNWSGFVAEFSHGGGIYRSFSTSVDDAVKSMRSRANPALQNALVQDETGSLYVDPSGPGKSPGEIEARKRALQDKPSTDLRSAAERASKFLSSLNMQDHSLTEQREAVEVMHLLLKATKPERYGQ